MKVAAASGSLALRNPHPISAVPDDGLRRHKIESGQTLHAIAKRYGVRQEDVMRANPGLKNPNHILVGATLIIPSPQPEAGVKASESASRPAARRSEGQPPQTTRNGELSAAAARAQLEAKLRNGPTPANRSGSTSGAKRTETAEPKPVGLRSVPSWSHGRQTGSIHVRNVDGKPVEQQAAAAFEQMQKAAHRDGVSLKLVSGYRTMAEQTRLYREHQAGRHKAAVARPGHSNHQNGRALDISTRGSYSSPEYQWLRKNAARFGFANTVAKEPWHWEYDARRAH